MSEHDYTGRAWRFVKSPDCWVIVGIFMVLSALIVPAIFAVMEAHGTVQ